MAFILASSVILIVWALLWVLREHITYSRQNLDILEASESMAKAAASSSHVEDLQTNAAAVWIAAFTLAVAWLVVICAGWATFVFLLTVILLLCTVLWALQQQKT